eukprot:TRINITY_DN4699_c0_g1_i1.p1 TRINITY_DN4699_c0_g1~~TRINITY_DN4699_c0_g1_i1.p1  ORF type:complete len:563 (-),score=65.16 TRINITY_DN4699_c0_g1_i1:195-1883(-)
MAHRGDDSLYDTLGGSNDDEFSYGNNNIGNRSSGNDTNGTPSVKRKVGSGSSDAGAALLSASASHTTLGTTDEQAPLHTSRLRRIGQWFDPGYPPAIKFIMGNEACERFSFYGLKAILAIYLHKYLLFSEDRSTFIIHAWIFVAYSFTVVGGYISDTWLGKFKTIIYVSLVYCLGSLTLSLTALPGATGDPPHWWGAALGLGLVAFGTGGIKPCVASFVGDQFVKGQEHLLPSVFAIFYFCINLGSLFSTILTPLLREYASYTVAFGVPAGLLLFATFVFFIGQYTYRKVPPGGSAINMMVGAIFAAIKGRFAARKTGERRDKFLDYAIPKYDKQFLDDVRSVLGVFKVFIPLPVFWSLFDQHSSRWVFQADDMNREVGFGIKLEPDQIPTLNPLLLLAMIPIFNKLVYPGLSKIGINLKPLMRMTIGMALAVASFIASGLIELWLQESYLHVAWQLPQYVLLAAGEIMVSITGLELAYSQAPASMKGIVMASWSLTTAFGNLLVAAIAEVELFGDQAIEFFFYAGLMAVFIVIFLLFCRGFKYKDPDALLDSAEPETTEKP